MKDSKKEITTEFSEKPSDENSLVFIGYKSIIRSYNAIEITNKILAEYEKRTGIEKETNNNILWKCKIGGGIQSQPLVDNQLLYVGSSDNHMYAFDCISGTIVWNFKTENEILCSPTIYSDTIYFGNWVLSSQPEDIENCFLFSVDKFSGRLIWKTRTKEDVDTPSVQNGIAYYGCCDGLYAIYCDTGKLKYKVVTEDYVGEISIIENFIYFTSAKYLYCYDTIECKVFWQFETGSDINSPPVINNETVYFGSEYEEFFAICCKTGILKWKFKTEGSIINKPYIHNEVIYVGCCNLLYAIGVESGDLRWKCEFENFVSAISIMDSILYIGNKNGKVYAVDCYSGMIKWEFESQIDDYTYPTAINGIVYIGTADGSLFVVRPNIMKDEH